MQPEITEIFNQYNKAKRFKESIGEKGLYEQSKINARFYCGNQWYGANCGNDRPLVRHNIIKRIGDFKIAQTQGAKYDVSFSADGISFVKSDADKLKDLARKSADKDFSFSGEVGEDEINTVCNSLSGYYRLTADRIGLNILSFKVLKNAYISGSGVLYTYWDSSVNAGFSSSGNKVKGDICCEVLDILDVHFADGYCENIQDQPYIILTSKTDKDALLREAERFGTLDGLKDIKPDDDNKVLVLTKLYKDYAGAENTVRCVKVTEKGYLRYDYDTRLRLYPLALFSFADSGETAYKESEITYLIPNQIAVNRMITAQVWSNISSGMPIMLVNGDTVSGDISNDPGQIIKIYGTNEDVEGAVKYVSPPDFSTEFTNSVNSLIENTLTQSGVNAAARGDEQAQNASAISRLQSAALMPFNIAKEKFKDFLWQNARVWADFWLTQYGSRKIKIEDENGTWYFPFNAQRYKDICINAAVTVNEAENFSNSDKTSALSDLYDKGIITKAQYLSRLPDALIPGKSALLSQLKEEKNEDL